MEYDKFIDNYELFECSKWIEKNNFKSIALQFSIDNLNYSVSVIKFLQKNLDKNVEFYTVVSNSCSVDYISPRHLGNNKIDAIIKFGNVCISPVSNTIKQIPVLFVFTNNLKKDEKDFLNKCLKTFKLSENNVQLKILIICEPKYISYTKTCLNDCNQIYLFGKFIKYSDQWDFTQSTKEFIINEKNTSSEFMIGQYSIENSLDFYDQILYIGDSVPLFYRIINSSNILEINMKEKRMETIQATKELKKRIAKIEKVKKLKKIGIIFSHSYPNVDYYIDEIKNFIKKAKKYVNLITLVQTTDQFKLGNFGKLDALVIVSECYCSNIIDNVSMHIPIINYQEFKIACNLPLKYGAIDWIEENIDDDEETSDSDDFESCGALVDYNVGKHGWYGLKVDAGLNDISELKDGLKGIASSYYGEGK